MCTNTNKKITNKKKTTKILALKINKYNQKWKHNKIKLKMYEFEIKKKKILVIFSVIISEQILLNYCDI